MHAVKARTKTTADSGERALGVLRKLVQDKELKNSRVRELIARCALDYDGHFTIEDLARMLRSSGVRTAHPATVYRSIPLLLEAGLIQLAPVGPGETQRYERAFERQRRSNSAPRHRLSFYPAAPRSWADSTGARRPW
jgi:Fur family transcriptional regulator, ferric uptake regulator